MAYAFQKPRDKARMGRKAPWYYGYVDEAGVDRQKKSAATSKTEAEALARDEEMRCERVRMGLERALPVPQSFADFASDYWKSVAQAKGSSKSIRSRLDRHLLPEFGPMLLTGIQTRDVDAFLNVKVREGLSPQSVEHLRRLLRAMFNVAIRWGKAAKNPVIESAPIPIPETEPRFLEPEQVARLLAAVPDRWRGFVAVAAYCGLRKGEIAGLTPDDIDLGRGIIHVRRSYDRPTTKGKRARIAPIPPELVPYLRVELARPRSRWVFSDTQGRMITESFDAAALVQKGLVDAGIVEGWNHKCRRCAFVERHADSALRVCPNCGMKLWAIPVPIAFTFHNLRSTYGTLAYEATDDARFVQKVLGHQDFKVTERYSRVRDTRLVSQATRIKFAAPKSDPGLTGADLSASKEGAPREIPEGLQSLPDARDAGVEPAAFGSGGHGTRLHTGINKSHLLTSSGRESEADLSALAATRTFSHPAPDPALTPPLRVEAGEGLLTVREVAALLRLSPATVYRLCHLKQLPCVRLGPSVRVRRADLEAFLKSRPPPKGTSR